MARLMSPELLNNLTLPEMLHVSAPLKETTTDLPYADYGYIPGVAQAAQAHVSVDPNLNPQPYFSDVQNAIANWWTNRVHLSPLGSAPLVHKGKPQRQA